jgi:hypothetical protein
MSEAVQSTAPGWLARNYGRIAALCFAVALIGVLVEIGAGFGYRFQMIPLQVALLKMLPIGAYISIGGAALCLAAVILAVVIYKGAFLKPAALVLVGLVVGAGAAYLPYSMSQVGAKVPPIHDITTDTVNPPVYIDVLPLREQTRASNTAEYLQENKLGSRVINVPEAQLKAYPDIKPVMLDGVAPADAYARALAAVKKEGWTIVADKPEEGRIEAWDKTLWFGFIDDVVIRVAPTDTGSKIDIRSLSRVGGSDVGKNAERIRGYIQTLLATKT